MMIVRALVAGLLGIAPGLTLALPASAADRPVVVELFTSQSCSSCPPAETYLGTLAQRPDVLALEWHVDYWDSLVYGRAGRWKDPFSNPDWTQRQRLYARAITGGNRIYTPQMVVDGAMEAVGSRRRAVEGLIARARGTMTDAVHLSALLANDLVTVRVGPAATDGPATVVLVSLLDRDVTQVARGENHGRTLANHNIVLEATDLGAWNGEALTARAPLAANANHCAVLVQRPGPGAVLGASYCDPRS